MAAVSADAAFIYTPYYLSISSGAAPAEGKTRVLSASRCSFCFSIGPATVFQHKRHSLAGMRLTVSLSLSAWGAPISVSVCEALVLLVCQLSYMKGAHATIDREPCWSLAEPERHPLYETAALMSKGGYGDLVSVFTRRGNGSTPSIFTSLTCTVKRKLMHSL